MTALRSPSRASCGHLPLVALLGPALLVESDQVFSDAERATLPLVYDPTSPEAALSGLNLIYEAAKSGKEVTGILLKNESQPTMAENVGIGGKTAPALLDISLAPNLQQYRDLLAEMR